MSHDTHIMVFCCLLRFVAQRAALIGDAAVGMHPVTAHGFNLGLSAQDALASEVKKAVSQGKDIGTQASLKRYEWIHRLNSKPIYEGTNALVGLFTNDSKPARWVRDITLKVANNLPPLKSLIVNKLTSSSV